MTRTLTLLTLAVLVAGLPAVALAGGGNGDGSATSPGPFAAADVLPGSLDELVAEERLVEEAGAEPLLVAQTGIADPASESRSRSREPMPREEPPDGHVPTWRMPAVRVTGHESPYREEERIGSYAQPRWTAHRRFPATRIYVRPEGEFDLEFWAIAKKPRHGDTTWITQTEAEIGLPYRFQLDLYLITNREGSDGETTFDQAAEIRWALANWGEIPLNPTLYFEWVATDSAPDVFEAKVLLGDELAPSWHYGVNLVWEEQTGGERERELEVTAAISKTLVDEKLSLGLESKLGFADVKDDRGDFEEDIRVGPSLQWRPTPRVHVDLAPLFGITGNSRRAEVYVVVGIEF